MEGAGTRFLWYPQLAAFRAGVVSGNQWDQTNTGYGSFATGNNTIASGDGATALGHDSKASGFVSIAIGEQCISNGETTVSIGAYNNVTGDNSAAYGESNTISGEHSLALGSGNTSTGDYSSAIGYENTSLGAYSTTIGNNTKAKAESGFALGAYNDQTDAPTATATATDRIFQLGNGTAATNSNAITVLRNGNTGFGTVNPTQKIEINKGRIRFSGDVDAGTAQGIEFTNATGSTLNGFIGRYNDSMMGFYGFTGAGWKMLYNNTNGNLGLQGNANPRVPLSFSNGAGNKISIYDNGDGTHYGIGLQAAKMQFYTPSSAQDIVFGTGSSTVFTENMRIKGNGNVGIGTNTPTNRLEVNGNSKIDSNLIVGKNTILKGELQLANVGTNYEGGVFIGGSPTIGKPKKGRVLMALDTFGNTAWQSNATYHAMMATVHNSFIQVFTPPSEDSITIPFKTSNPFSILGFDDMESFNNTTSIFTAPEKGLYIVKFNVNIQIFLGYATPDGRRFSSAKVQAYKNGINIYEKSVYNVHNKNTAVVSTGDESWTTEITGDFMIKLNEGESLRFVGRSISNFRDYSTLTIYKLY